MTSDLDISCQIGNTLFVPSISDAINPFSSYSVHCFLMKFLDITTIPKREFASPLSIFFLRLSPHARENSSYQTFTP